ncbi:MAG TPA: guanylate kinase [Acidimicrobiales bacterium]|nr:guanylate kinase [Acidimicrobiales bacterium]
MIFIISGPGGVGKGTVVDRLLELMPDLWLSRSWTTRPRRSGEPEEAYVFVDREAFEKRINEGGFLEWTEFPGTGAFYGTPSIDTASTDAGGRDVLLEIELDGAQQVKQRFPDAVLIFIVAPSTEAQEERLRHRGDDKDAVDRRIAVGAKELEVGERIADHVVVNDDVERAAREVAGILAGYRERGPTPLEQP